MSYNIGQIRYVPPVDPEEEKQKWAEFLTEVEYKETFIPTLKDEAMIEFKNYALDVTGSNAQAPLSLTPTDYYYLHFRIYKRLSKEEVKENVNVISLTEDTSEKLKDDGSQTISLKLRKKNSTEKDITQEIKTYTISPAVNSEEEFSDFEIIIAPDSDYQYVLFFLERTTYDYQTSEPRELKIKILDFAIVKNIANKIFTDLQIANFSKIGIQSAPGTLMCINGEEIRVGRTGIYEINNGVPVSFIGFASTKENLNDNPRINFFILDYAYETL